MYLEKLWNYIMPGKPTYDACEREINDLREYLGQIDLVKRDPKYFIYEHFSKLKHEVDLRKETIALELENRYAKVIDEIEKAESKCQKMITENLGNSTPALGEGALRENFDELIRKFEALEIGNILFVILKY